MEKGKYFASFFINNGSAYNERPYIGESLQKLITDMKAIVKDSHYKQPYNRSYFKVCDSDGREVARYSLTGISGKFQKEQID